MHLLLNMQYVKYGIFNYVGFRVERKNLCLCTFSTPSYVSYERLRKIYFNRQMMTGRNSSGESTILL